MKAQYLSIKEGPIIFSELSKLIISTATALGLDQGGITQVILELETTSAGSVKEFPTLHATDFIASNLLGPSIVIFPPPVGSDNRGEKFVIDNIIVFTSTLVDAVVNMPS